MNEVKFMPVKFEDNNESIHLSLKNHSLAEMESIQKRLNDYIKKFKDEIDQEQKTLELARQLELSGNIKISIKRTAFKRPPKYQFKDNGEIKTWAGVGKMPLGLKKLIANGKALDDYLIDKSGTALYMFKDSKGQIQTWTGKGKKPHDLEALILKGFPLDNFKI